MVSVSVSVSPLRPLREIKRQSSVIHTPKNFTSVCVVQGRKNPRVDKARSSYEISHEPE